MNPGMRCGLLVLALAAAGASGCEDDPIEFGTPGPNKPIEEEAFAPAAGGIRRLLARQYVSSVRVLLGEVGAAAADPPPDAQLSGLEAIGAAQLPMPPSAIEKYEQSARAIAAAAVSDPATLDAILPCTLTGNDDTTCFRLFASTFGRLAWRRPLNNAEMTDLAAVATVAATEAGDPLAGVEAAISTMLQSPYFLYLVEIGQPDPDTPGTRTLTPFELAARMSMFLLQATPDAALLDLAESGGLDEEQEIRATAAAMLARPEAREALDSFYDELFRLRDLPSVSKDPVLFPQFTAQLKEAMRTETLLFLDDIIWERNADAREIFDGTTTFVNADLAALYGVPAPAGGFAKVTLPPGQMRAGILGHASFLSRFAHPGMTSPTRRGLFIQSTLLCRPVDPPPQDVNPNLPPDDGTPKTMKDKVLQHQNEERCAACHHLMDPLGLALENYDAIGAFRTMDKGLPIDTAGEIVGFGSFASAADIGALLRADEHATQCMVRQLFRQSMGHVETEGEAVEVRALDQAFADASYRIQDWLVELCASRAFRLVGEPK